MHYKNNREAKEGDPVIIKEYNNVYAGKLHSLNPGTNSCNAQIAYPIMGGFGNICVTVRNCYHAEDAFNAMENNREQQELNKECKCQ